MDKVSYVIQLTISGEDIASNPTLITTALNNSMRLIQGVVDVTVTELSTVENTI